MKQTVGLSEETLNSIRKLTDDFFTRTIFAATRDVEKELAGRPFHTAFFRRDDLLAALRERSVVTSLGQHFIPELAKVVALDAHEKVARDAKVSGQISEGELQAIERIVTELRAGKPRVREPNHAGEMTEIRGKARGSQVKISVICDILVDDFAPGPLHLELKGPTPNLDICAESKKKLLTFKVLLANRNPQSYFAFWYNPFLSREAYAHSFTRRVFDMNKEVVMGQETWNLLGGSGTWEEILRTIQDVSTERWKEEGAG